MISLSGFEELSKAFGERFEKRHFPELPQGLYDAAQYPFQTGGKRIRPVMCLMGNQLFSEINENTWNAAQAIELFHNFTLVHDDIMDDADIRRGVPSVHAKFGRSIGILSGDTILIYAYILLSGIEEKFQKQSLELFNDVARMVCEGQYLDMDFETKDEISMDEYIEMISLKTSVLIASSLKMGAMLGGASQRNQNNLYEFGKNLGIAFQIQDDYLDVFGDQKKLGKKIGGDIMANKKTFLYIYAANKATKEQQLELKNLSLREDEGKIAEMIGLYESLGAEEWTRDLKNRFYTRAMNHLEDVAVVDKRKEPLKHLVEFLLNRDQ